jgi:putative PIN family toxin of toxin-antitoxin system
MKTVVLDTNILLDIFVFNDHRASELKQALLNQEIHAPASQKTFEELADVIGRPIFNLNNTQQDQILKQWHSLASLVSDDTLASAPWNCEDEDDQIFLDLAYKLKPAIIISKDNALLKLSKKAAAEEILITADYQAFKLSS